MTTASASQPITTGGLLFGDSGIGSALQASGAADAIREKLANFTDVTRNEAVQEFGRISADLLDLNLADVLLGALSTYEELRAAGRRTLNAPDSEEFVELLSHQVTLHNRPSIALLINGAEAATVHLVLSLVMNIQALTAVVREGRLTALRVGRSDIDASISVEGTTVARKLVQLQLPVSVPTGTGLPLTDSAPDATQPPRFS
jgi:hypothetical protein